MKLVLFLVAGVTAGAIAAALRPRETRRVLDAARLTGLDRTLLASAASAFSVKLPSNIRSR